MNRFLNWVSRNEPRIELSQLVPGSIIRITATARPHQLGGGYAIPNPGITYPTSRGGVSTLFVVDNNGLVLIGVMEGTIEERGNVLGRLEEKFGDEFLWSGMNLLSHVFPGRKLIAA